MTDARGVFTSAASLLPEGPTSADGAVVVGMATVGVVALRVPLRVLRAEGLCAERTVDLAA
jgi:hypothetical protein